MTKAGKGFGVVILIAVVILVALYLRKKEPPTFEIATVGRVDSRFSMEFPEYGQNLTYIEISPIVGKYGRVFIAPTADYSLSWSKLKENIIAGKYRELTPFELEAYWIA